MIEDEDVKIAESPEEAIWINVMKEAEVLIKSSENNLIIQNALLELAKQKLEEMNIKEDPPAGVG